MPDPQTARSILSEASLTKSKFLLRLADAPLVIALVFTAVVALQDPIVIVAVATVNGIIKLVLDVACITSTALSVPFCMSVPYW